MLGLGIIKFRKDPAWNVEVLHFFHKVFFLCTTSFWLQTGFDFEIEAPEIFHVSLGDTTVAEENERKFADGSILVTFSIKETKLLLVGSFYFKKKSGDHFHLLQDSNVPKTIQCYHLYLATIVDVCHHCKLFLKSCLTSVLQLFVFH